METFVCEYPSVPPSLSLSHSASAASLRLLHIGYIPFLQAHVFSYISVATVSGKSSRMMPSSSQRCRIQSLERILDKDGYEQTDRARCTNNEVRFPKEFKIESSLFLLYRVTQFFEKICMNLLKDACHEKRALLDKETGMNNLENTS